MSQQPVTRQEVVDIAGYEKIRKDFRAQVIAEKERRRVGVGEHFTFLFENHLTVLYQVQEMMRTERIVEEQAIAHELTTYNELIAPPGGLSATLLIAYDDRALREINLPRLMGLENHVRIAVGDLPPVPAAFAAAQIGETQISSVQYITFPLGEAHRAAWQDAAEKGQVRLAVDHPHYSHQTVLPAEIARALQEDFS